MSTQEQLKKFRTAWRKLRKVKGQNQSEWAEICARNLRTYHKTEIGNSPQTIEDLFRMATYLKMPVTDFFYINPDTGVVERPIDPDIIRLQESNAMLIAYVKVLKQNNLK